MREIKFKGKRVDNGEWVHGWLMFLGKDYRDIDCAYIVLDDGANIHNRISFNRHSVIPETVSQYTGIKDKNGVDIYEFDIVNAIGGVATIVYWNAGFYLEYNKDSHYSISNCTITGSIHDKN